MDKQQIIDTLNLLRAKELFAIQQYMHHHYTVDGMDFSSIRDFQRSISIAEMRHAEALAERINMLGGEPITHPGEVEAMKGMKVEGGETAKAQIHADLELERGAIVDYTNAIREIGDTDPGIRKMLEDILAQEEEHADTYASWLGEKMAYEIPTEETPSRKAGRPEKGAA